MLKLSTAFIKASFILWLASSALAQKTELIKIFQNCHKQSDDFDPCMQKAFNELTVYYKAGIPELGIEPFDPHHIPYVKQTRTILDGLIKYRIILKDVYEHQWSNSYVTSFKSDPANHQFLYSQDFPDKYLDGHFEVKASVFGNNIQSEGKFKVSLFNYSQTMTVQRTGGPGSKLKVKLHIDGTEKIGLAISDSTSGMDSMKFTFKEFHPTMLPDIHAVISVMFTDIFNKSFRKLDVDEFIKD